jgi:hypothetical protein
MTNNNDKTVFKGPSKFIVKPKDHFNYELTFLPNAEEKFSVGALALYFDVLLK